MVFHTCYLQMMLSNAEQASRIRNLILVFEKGTGQKLSPAKCSLLAQNLLDAGQKEDIRAVLGVEKLEFEAKYLGLQTPEGRQKRDRFQSLQERMGKHMAM